MKVVVKFLLMLSISAFLVGCGGGGGGSNNQSQEPGKNEPAKQPNKDNNTSGKDSNATEVEPINEDKNSTTQKDKNSTQENLVVTVSDDFILQARVTTSSQKQTAKEVGKGKYKFEKPVSETENYIQAIGGYIDFNNNAKIDEDEKSVQHFTLKAPISSNVINPFTTILYNAKTTSEKLSKLFGLKSIFISTQSDSNVSIRKAVFLANAIIGESEKRSKLYDPSFKGCSVDYVDDGKPVVPLAIKNSYELVLDYIFSEINKGKSLDKILYEKTKSKLYSNISTNINEINKNIISELKRYKSLSGNVCDEKDAPVSKEDPVDPVDPTPIDPTPIDPTPVEDPKTTDGYFIAKISNNIASFKSTPTIIRVNGVFHFIRNSAGFVYDKPSSTNSIYAPNPISQIEKLNLSCINNACKLTIDDSVKESFGQDISIVFK